MNAEFIPKIRLEVESMTAAIIQCMGFQDSEVGELIKQQIERSIVAYDFESHVRRAVWKVVDDAILAEFTYGKSAKKITEAVSKAIFVQVDDVAPENPETI